MKYKIAVSKCRTKWEITDLNGSKWEVGRIQDLLAQHVVFTDNGGNAKSKMFYVEIDQVTLSILNGVAVFTSLKPVE